MIRRHDPASLHSLSHSTRIKICGLTREADVDAAVEAGADAIGLVLYPKSPRARDARPRGRTGARLPPFVTPVLLFVNAAASEVMAALCAHETAMLQFHGDETPAQCEESSGPGGPYMRAARIPLGAAGVGFDLLKFASDYSHAQAILLDAHVEGLWRRRQGIRLVTSSTKRHSHARFVWWAHTCKRERWHPASAAALPVAGR
jgi:phosphoribosylanthranilate isomerase